MPITLRQSASASAGEGTRSTTAAFFTPTLPGSLLVALGVFTHEGDEGTSLGGPSGFTLVKSQKVDELTVAMWVRENAPASSFFTVSSSARRSIQFRVLELTGAAQSGALDKLSFGYGTSKTVTSGAAGPTAQADSVVIGVIGNRYASVTQGGATGGLGKLYESTSPTPGADDERSRMTVYGATTAAVGTFSLGATLSASRDWVAILAAFRGGSIGPARMTALNTPSALTITGGGLLTQFGPLLALNAGTALTITGSGELAPFEEQYRIGRPGFVLGRNTPYNVEKIDGLYGWQVRTNDDDLPRGDGAQRGVDLQAARLFTVNLNFDGVDEVEVEQRLVALYKTLVPRRHEDLQFMWRHPGQEPRIIYCRPVDLTRELTVEQMIVAKESVALRAADPRHYSWRTRRVDVPVATAGAVEVPVVSAINAGNSRAYPIITIGAAPSVEVSRVELVNATADVRFDVQTLMPPGSTLIGDMPAVITAAPRSKVRLDDQSRYGAWQFPREPFFLAPDPDVPAGVNALFIRTTPAGAPITCSIEWRDTWAG